MGRVVRLQLLMGGGCALFDNVPASKLDLELRVVPGNGVTHLRYRVFR